MRLTRALVSLPARVAQGRSKCGRGTSRARRRDRVPADRGGVGRYVDGLIAALAEAGADLAVVVPARRRRALRRLAPQARVVAGPPAIAHRPARLAWEQTGLPLVAQQVGADVIHSPHYTMPLRRRPARWSSPSTTSTFFTEPELHSAVKAHVLPVGDPHGACAARPGCIVPSKATRDELDPAARRRPDRASTSPTTVSTSRSSTRRPTPRRRASPTGSACAASPTSRSSACSSRARTCPT